jgi:SAM-dependent methyltransferase
MGIHDVAARGFERGADDYERGRPSYPQAALAILVAELRMGPGSVVVDLGAGTGKLTRQLVATGARVIAVEPVEAMRATLAGAVPGVEILGGAAEAVPLRDGVVDVVVAAQAFHWFRAVDALAEIRRVLRPGGGLGLLWNERDRTVPWAHRLKERMDQAARGIPRYGDGRWREFLVAAGGFGELGHRQVPNPHRTDLDTMLAGIASNSYVSALPDVARERLLHDVTVVLQAGPLADEGASFTDPYLTDVFWCTRT